MTLDKGRRVEPGSLAEVDLFRGLAPADLARLAGLLEARWYPARTPVVTANQPGDMICVVREGAVKVFVTPAGGSQVILAILTAGEVVGEMSVVDSLARSATVVTLDDSLLLWMDRATFLTCLRSMPPLSLNLASILSRRLRVANAQIRARATLDVHARLAWQLLSYAEEYGRPGPDGGVLIPFRLTQSDLAGLIGSSRVRVNHVLVEWKSRGYLSVDDDLRLTLHQPAALPK